MRSNTLFIVACSGVVAAAMGGLACARDTRSGVGVKGASPIEFGAKCDGVTDDTAALNRFLSATAASSERGLIPASRRCNARQLILPSHLHLVLLPDSELFQIANSDNDFLTMASGTVDVSINGTGVINGNRAHQAPQTARLPGACVNAFGVTGLFIGPIRITQCSKFPVNVWGNGAGSVSPSQVVLRDTVISFSGNSPEFVRCTNCWAYNVQISHIDDYAFSFYQGAFHSGAVGGTFDRSAGGISVLTDALDGLMSNDVKIESTSASYNDGPGYLTWNNGGPVHAQHTKIQFISVGGDHNHLDAGKSGSQNFGGVWMQACNECSVMHSAFHHDGAQKNEVSVGVFIADLVRKPIVNANKIYDEGSFGLGVGVSISPDTFQPLVTDNTIWDNRSPRMMAFGLNGTCGSGMECKICCNRLGDFLGAANNIRFESRP